MHQLTYGETIQQSESSPCSKITEERQTGLMLSLAANDGKLDCSLACPRAIFFACTILISGTDCCNDNTILVNSYHDYRQDGEIVGRVTI